MRTRGDELLLGEWCCLGLLASSRAHGFALAKRLAPNGDIGRIWSVSRALTYRALMMLEQRGLIVAVASERGVAGGDRTIYAPTRAGRTSLRRWLKTPVAHVRDVRSELLVKLELCRLLKLDPASLIESQRAHFRSMAPSRQARTADPVEVWRQETIAAVFRFLDRLDAGAHAQ